MVGAFESPCLNDELSFHMIRFMAVLVGGSTRGRTGTAGVVLVAFGSLLGGCAAVGSIQNAGMFSTAPRSAGKVDISAQARTIIWGGSGSLHVEPWLTNDVSLPISLSGGWPHFAGGRVGVRHRQGRVVTLGGGVSYAPVWSYSTTCGRMVEDCDPLLLHAGGLDFELGLGNRWQWFALTFSFRPFFRLLGELGDRVGGFAGGAALELDFAFFVARRFALTVGLEGSILAPPVGVDGGDVFLPAVFSGAINIGVFWEI